MKSESSINRPKSQIIAEVIAKQNQVAAVEWLHAILEEHVAGVRQELVALKEAHGPDGGAAMPEIPPPAAVIVKAIAPPSETGKTSSAAMKGYWANMTPEQRSIEMRRRQAIGEKKKAGETGEVDVYALHPRDKRSPRHAVWKKKMRRAVRTRFDNMSPVEMERWKANMALGRRRAKS